METIIRQYMHRPNATELGIGNTHETYMLVNKDTDLSPMFPIGVEIEVEDTSNKNVYSLKSALGREFRVNQMGQVYRDYSMRPGDEVIFTQVAKSGISKCFLTVKKKKRVVLIVDKKGVELANENNLSEYGNSLLRQYKVTLYNRGILSELIIKFKESKKKRVDSPNETDFFDVTNDGKELGAGVYYLTLDSQPNLTTLTKSEYNVIEFDDNIMDAKLESNIEINEPLQQIYYGAPGTGKSHAVREVSEQYPDTIRTTFHPDSDYASFVGAYKPTVAMEKLYDEAGVPIKVGGQELSKNQITYKFVKQAFLKAYVNAWKKFKEAKDASDIKCQFLVIEEINRGNCAQIFGDLFQLLDRKNGFSEYPIEADEDIAKSLLEEETPENPSFGKDGLQLDSWQKEYIENLFQKSKDKDVIVEKISKGRVLVLPCNLYIWATMNTSDQSLFPIDSAFKRRWDWKYVPINTEVKKWAIEVDGQKYSWTSFLNQINDQIFSVTHSEDKKFGFFFCHADKKSDESVEEEDVISAERFVSKVIFFVYNDVFKDYGFDRKMFQGEDGKAIQFHEYYRMDGSVDESKVKRFLDNLEVCTLS